MRNLFLIIFNNAGFCACQCTELVLPLYGKAEFEKIASLDDEMPELHVYLTDKPSSQAVVVCPGGGYKGLSFARRESLWQNGLNQNGIAAFGRQIQDASGKARGACRRFDKGF